MSEPVVLFQAGDFTLASGARSAWKIECDALTPEDWAGLAVMLAPLVGRFDRVLGVPRGGVPLATAMEKHITDDAHLRRVRGEGGGSIRILVVDDVWTTGGSMDRFICDSFSGWTYNPEIQRAVVFARNPPSRGVVALFTMAGSRDEVRP